MHAALRGELKAVYEWQEDSAGEGAAKAVAAGGEGGGAAAAKKRE